MIALRNATLVLFGLLLGLTLLEGTMRVTGWLFLRARHAPTLPADKGTIRVLCLGESTTADMEFLGRESYPAQLEQILNAQSRRFVVVNGGVPATTTDAIVRDLPATLDRERPDMVVTMMGINDGMSSDPAFQITHGPGLKVAKLARLLWASWRGASRPAMAHVFADLPNDLQLSRRTAWEAVLAGRTAEATLALAPMLADDAPPMVRLHALGTRAIAEWHDGKLAEAEASHAAFVALDRTLPRDGTAQNYRRLQAILRERGIPLVAVQYPALPVASLLPMLDPDVAAIVDNEEPFLAVYRRGEASRAFRDLFAGLFGHLTPDGNRLLATNVAHAILTRP